MKIIGLTGQAGAGKTTLANLLRSQYDFEGKTVKVLAFADILKSKLINVLGIDSKYLYSSDWKNHKPPGYQVTGREVMQLFGTEFVRRVCPTFWCDAMIRRIQELDKKHDNLVIIIDDVRFLDEAAVVKMFDGRIYRVYRPGKYIEYRRKFWEIWFPKGHQSETEHELINCETVHNFEGNKESMLREFYTVEDW